MKALILAAGLGTRLRPYTDHTPKPLFPVDGRPLLDIWIHRLARAGCEAVMINTHHLGGQIAAHVAAGDWEIPVVIRHEPEILGTGGAIRNGADFWDDRPFLVINADVLSTIDLRAFYDFHCGHAHPVSLVLCDAPPFNHVCVTPGGFVSGFHRPESTGERRRAFTGIQAADPDLLDVIPPGVCYSSIDAYARMLEGGRKIRAWMPKALEWQDLGTPARYRHAVLGQMAGAAFRAAWPDLPEGEIRQTRLRGDGSDRGWFRLTMSGKTLILADHGIRTRRGGTAEADAFVAIGRHLREKGNPVPRIFRADPFSGLVFLEDRGDVHLQDAVRNAGTADAVTALYRQVIDRLVSLSLSGAEDFDPAWTCQTERYDHELILDRECRYFTEAFLQGYAGADVSFASLRDEFERLAEDALRFAVTGFMHRDMQSRNIMVRDGRVCFIDFQGGRMGPIQYDLASLLIDPYVSLPGPVRDRLLRYCIERLSARRTVDPERFTACYEGCALARNLQMLGAFGFLSRVRGKTGFEVFIPPALDHLKRLLDRRKNRFPKLRRVVSAL
ncbi:hypothetical protein DENIS_2882 [Desulfonema ishimotonii]|uniref:Aminoglycoside phosphotransferase n=1 Tax=Desulfonema ishimotonii TaxID=45657 RepID=A0A401FY89_9BACT|nr:sugar phosphate nucleotidyltransferase [Desulfonema ishimotonii]GBC61920.1 hypothetical protein DENIS_2882 [Desulfonema ishimotonii]